VWESLRAWEECGAYLCLYVETLASMSPLSTKSARPITKHNPQHTQTNLFTFHCCVQYTQLCCLHTIQKLQQLANMASDIYLVVVFLLALHFSLWYTFSLFLLFILFSMLWHAQVKHVSPLHLTFSWLQSEHVLVPFSCCTHPHFLICMYNNLSTRPK